MTDPRIMRADTQQVTVSIDGRPFGVFESRSGGEGDSEETKVRLGAMGGEISIGGAQTMENVTVGKLFDVDTIGQELAFLYAARGRKSATVTTQPLDKDGNVYGKPWSYRGLLKRVKAPEYDASSDDAAMIELEISVDSEIIA